MRGKLNPLLPDCLTLYIKVISGLFSRLTLSGIYRNNIFQSKTKFKQIFSLENEQKKSFLLFKMQKERLFDLVIRPTVKTKAPLLHDFIISSESKTEVSEE